MFVLFFLGLSFLINHDQKMLGIGFLLIRWWPRPLHLMPSLQKKINIGSLGRVYEDEKDKFLEGTMSGLVLGLCLLGSWLFHVGFEHMYYIIFTSLLPGLMPYMTMHKLYKANSHMIDKKLPLLLSQMILLIGAGMTTVKALERVTQNQEDLLTQELYGVTQAVKLGGSFERWLMRFMDQCQQGYITRFGRILLSHEKNGTDASRQLLQELVEDLWKARRSHALKRGEEASTQLLFPMSIALIATVMVMTLPAIYEIFTFT